PPNSTPGPSSPPSGTAIDSSAPRRWPDGTRVLEFENLEGVILLQATLHGSGGRDTTGLLVLDTGAGYLALDDDLAIELGVAKAKRDEQRVELASGALRRLEIGGMQIDQVTPILTVDLDIVRRVTDRPVLGLLGQKLFSNYALSMDYQRNLVALIPVGPTSTTDRDTTSGGSVERASGRAATDSPGDG